MPHCRPFSNFKQPFIIAEIGGNHEGDFEYAKKLLLDAAASGADAVKFQTYTADKIVSPVSGEVRNAHFKKFELDNDAFHELHALAQNNGIEFMTSLWDADALDELDPLLATHKIGSGDMTNYPLIEKILSTNKPTLIATAMSTLEEIEDLVRFVEKVSPQHLKEDKLCLMHCVAMYGEPRDEYAQLAAIQVLQDRFPNIPIGYSDHTVGTYACELALGMGVSAIEVHFTDDKTREFRDHHLSIDVSDMKYLLEKREQIMKMRGRYEKSPLATIETEDRIREFRRSIHVALDLEAGHILSESDVVTLRPAVGIDAREFSSILGKKLTKEKKKFEPLLKEDIS